MSFISGGDSNLERLKLLRALRVVRLAKLLRLLRGMRLFKRWELQLSIDYAVLAVARSIMSVMLVSHWLACLWQLQVSFGDSLEGSWVDEKAYCLRYDSADWLPRYSSPSPTGDDVYGCLPPNEMYTTCLYFCVMTITSVSFQ